MNNKIRLIWHGFVMFIMTMGFYIFCYKLDDLTWYRIFGIIIFGLNILYIVPIDIRKDLRLIERENYL